MAFEFPSYSSKVHRSEYPAISPSNPVNSAEGRIVLITGGGAGIGLAIAEAFVTAKAKAVVILGRRKNVLQDATESLKKLGSAQILAFTADVTDAAALDKAFASTAEQVGPVDVVIANAGYLPAPAPLANANLEDWWKGFEINVYGTALLFRAWMAHRGTGTGPHKPAFISVNSSVAHIKILPTMSAYAASKSGLATMMTTLQAENPDIHIASFHPGVVETDMNRETVKANSIATDNPSLPAGFAVWLCSPAAEFLGGKFVWAQWDVQELIENQQEILRHNQLRMGLMGFPKFASADIVTPSQA